MYDPRQTPTVPPQPTVPYPQAWLYPNAAALTVPLPPRPGTLTALGVVCLVLAVLATGLSVVEWRVMSRHHAAALPKAPPPPPAPPSVPPGLVPVGAEFLGPAGLPRADRAAVAARVAEGAGDWLTPDRRFLLDAMLAERGADVLAARGARPDVLARVTAEPPKKVRGGRTDGAGAVAVDAPGGRVLIDVDRATFVPAAGPEATIRGTSYNGPEGSWQVAAVVEAEMARAWRAAGVRPNAHQAASLYAAARAGLLRDALFFGAGHWSTGTLKGGTVRMVHNDSQEAAWALPTGQLVRVQRTREHTLDPATGQPPPPAPPAAAGPPLLPLWAAWWLWVVAYVELVWAVLMILLAALLLADVRWARTALLAWAAGRVAIILVGTWLAVSGVQDAQGGAAPAFSVGTLVGLVKWLWFPAAVVLVLLTPAVSRYHAALRLRAAGRAGGGTGAGVGYAVAAVAVVIGAWQACAGVVTGMSAAGAAAAGAGLVLLAAGVAAGWVVARGSAARPAGRRWTAATVGLSVAAAAGLAAGPATRPTRAPLPPPAVPPPDVPTRPVPVPVVPDVARPIYDLEEPRLLADLRSADPAVRFDAMARIRAARGGDAWLHRQLGRDANPLMRDAVIAAVAEGLWRRTAFDPLLYLPHLEPGGGVGRSSAAGDTFARLAFGDRGPLGQAAAKACSELSYSSIIPGATVAAALSDPAPDGLVRDRALTLIEGSPLIRREAIAALEALAVGPDDAVAGVALRRLLAVRSYKGLSAALGHESPARRLLAVKLAAGHERLPVAVDGARLTKRIQAMADDDPSPDVRAAAAAAAPGYTREAVRDLERRLTAARAEQDRAVEAAKARLAAAVAEARLGAAAAARTAPTLPATTPPPPPTRPAPPSSAPAVAVVPAKPPAAVPAPATRAAPAVAVRPPAVNPPVSNPPVAATPAPRPRVGYVPTPPTAAAAATQRERWVAANEVHELELRDHMASPDVAVRRAAVELIERQPNAVVHLPPLVAAVWSDADPAVRSAAGRVLRARYADRLGPATSVRVTAMGDPSTATRLPAALLAWPAPAGPGSLPPYVPSRASPPAAPTASTPAEPEHYAADPIRSQAVWAWAATGWAAVAATVVLSEFARRRPPAAPPVPLGRHA